MQILTDFVEAQASYFHQCNQHAQELQKHLARCVWRLIDCTVKFSSWIVTLRLQDQCSRLQVINGCFYGPGSIPAVLCSNNWQAAVGSEDSQQPSGHQVANEPGRLSAASNINVHRLPEFDQDSWTVNAPPGTEKPRENLQLQDLPNNNNNNSNNNNKALARGQCSAASQAADPDSSPLDSITPLRTAEAAGAAPGGAGTLTATASPPSELNGAAAADGVTVVSLAFEGVEPVAINGEDVQESSSSSGDVVP